MSTEVIVAFISGVLGPIILLYTKNKLEKKKDASGCREINYPESVHGVGGNWKLRLDGALDVRPPLVARTLGEAALGGHDPLAPQRQPRQQAERV